MKNEYFVYSIENAGLTQEQIEAEGWIYNKELSTDYEKWFEKGILSLLVTYFKDGIIIELGLTDEPYKCYQGICNDINQFKHICKYWHIMSKEISYYE